MNPSEPHGTPNTTSLRRTYVKPQVEMVNLQPKQTVLGGCLISSAGAASTQQTGCFFTGGGTCVTP
jgi:hypothetical protein